MRDQILAKVSDLLIHDFNVEAGAIREEANFRSHLRLDSLSLVDLIYLVQKDFGFKAAVHEFGELHTVGSLVDFIVARKAG